jgi:rhodanese-related sulfurtransferase
MNISFSALSKLSSSNTNVNAVFSARTMQTQELASRMHKSRSVLVLDCRPFVSYNIAHIQGAINVNCADRFNRRRLQQGKASIVDLVSSKEGKDMFKKRSSKEIVIYDDHTKDAQSLCQDSSMYMVLSSLLREGKDAYILKGLYHFYKTLFNLIKFETFDADFIKCTHLTKFIISEHSFLYILNHLGDFFGFRRGK